jgi:hypothetical protein
MAIGDVRQDRGMGFVSRPLREFASAQAQATRDADAERWREASVATDVDSAVSLPALRF